VGSKVIISEAATQANAVYITVLQLDSHKH